MGINLPVRVERESRPIVTIQNNEAMADSRHVAAYFGKEHRRVLQTIRELHCSAEFRQHNFVPFKNKDLTGETTSHVLMTKDGFAFVVLGFTGHRAGAFKEAYIAQFNTMEAELRRRGSADPLVVLQDPEALRGLLLNYAERAAELQQRVALLEPQAEALERIAGSDGSLCITDAAKSLQVAPKALFERLRAERWTYRRPGGHHEIAYQDRIDAGLLEHKVVRQPRGEGRPDFVTEQVRVTPKGLARLAAILSPAD